jgi:hypothetical protein
LAGRYGMRIPKARIDGRRRITEFEIKFEEVMKEGDDYLEIEIAMLNVLSRIKNREFVESYPLPEE